MGLELGLLLIIRSRPFATFSAIEKALAGQMWPAGCMNVVQACYSPCHVTSSTNLVQLKAK